MVCMWELDTGCCTATWDAASTVAKTRAQEYATYVLWALTGRRFGPCAVTIRPCPAPNWPLYETYTVDWDGGSGGQSYVPYLWNGSWKNCGCSGWCGCRVTSEIMLPGPVAAVSEVRVDGAVVPTTSYRVDDRTYLVRTDGQAWPDTNNLDLPATAVGTFAVTYLRGEPVPPGGAAAAGTLACEYLKACANQPCRLPKRVTSVSRQGVSISVKEAELRGETGIPEVDAWIAAVNPGRRQQAPRVYNPDLSTMRVTTWG